MTQPKPTALVLGAGIQGVCAAFALNSRGYRVTLVDQADGCMTRASGRNEAKIHLGFVYANDPSFRTASLMLNASLAFDSLLESWLERPLNWPSMRSTPFVYAVMNDSLLSVDELCEFYERVQGAYNERHDGRSYLGDRPERLWWPASDVHGRWANGVEVSGLIETAEVALDLVRLRAEVDASLAAFEGIKCEFGVRVESAERRPSGFRVSGTDRSGESWQRDADILVNCLWEGRLGLDETMGLRPTRPWVYRLKYRLMGQLPAELKGLPSFTFVLGPYGDIATYPAAPTYLSWYPACMRAWSDELAPPTGWAEACRGVVPQPTAAEIASDTLAALEKIIPGVGRSRVDQVDAGVIFSWGKTHVDVDDPVSELHERHAIGVHAQDGYFSIDTGKFTCAPLFANQLLEHLA